MAVGGGAEFMFRKDDTKLFALQLFIARRPEQTPIRLNIAKMSEESL